ncbi:MAG TPA: esterase-like activity of phytase family protein [Sphingopyxis sp.]|nr:esterase-like activity of phytase family protein [Sphingopyxis sp.]HMP44692.1 esterase-like activity of phytase family protein [Sphingopyxis sp.]HMQ19254.1 esterase-like activity of phytase family protein [Sphingopyxis sp.]
MRRLLPAALIFLALGPVPGGDIRYRTIDTRQSVEARALVHPAGDAGPLRFVRGWRLVSPHSHFGGFSGLARLGPDRFLLVGDNGYATRLTLGADGRVGDVSIGLLPLPPRNPGRKAFTDVEALAVDADSGRVWVALEGIDQIWRLDPALTRIESRNRSPQLEPWPANRGAEAMARLADGRTIILSEGADDDNRGTEALLFAGDPAKPGRRGVRFFYDAQGKGQVSDAAPLPDGRVLLVHRRLGLSPLFTTILGVLDPADIAKDAVVRSVAIGRVPGPLRDNYEGAAVAVEDGRTFLWLVSDDNFNSWQRSLLLQFELVDLPDSKKAAP